MPTPSTHAELPLGLFLNRFRLVLADLGLPVPADWITTEDGTAVSFADLTPQQADRLLQAFEAVLELIPDRPSVRHSELDQTLLDQSLIEKFVLAVPSLALSEVF